jgi:D-alanyl-D-alanine carboxypeptidase
LKRSTIILAVVVMTLLAVAEQSNPRSVIEIQKEQDILELMKNNSSEEAVIPKGDRLTEASCSRENSEDWMLILVNHSNPLPNTYEPLLANLSNGMQFDRRAMEQLDVMLSAARAQGLFPVICSAYRSIEYQQRLFNNQVHRQMSRGLDRQQAEVEAGKIVAYPGTSEHNLGLAVDIVSLDYQHLDEAQANTAEVKWLTQHCSEYGFILRYPKDKTDITGIVYEPWHFRYVGIDAAKAIMQSGYCLEEYLEFIRK